MSAVTVWPSLYRPAEGSTLPLGALCEHMREPRTYITKDDVPRWSWGVYRDGYRNLASFVSAAGLALDLDGGATRDEVLRAFGDLNGFVHSTWRHSPEAPRWRLAVALSRPVDREEHDRCWRALASMAEDAGIAPDYQGRDACHAWALPAMRPGYEHVELTGAPFDVEAALARFPTPEPEPEPERRPRSNDLAHRSERARRYLATVPGAISGSGGHAATFRAALVLVRGFELPEDEALALLVSEYNPRCAPPWSVRELRHKVRSAATRGRVASGWLADRPLTRTSTTRRRTRKQRRTTVRPADAEGRPDVNGTMNEPTDRDFDEEGAPAWEDDESPQPASTHVRVAPTLVEIKSGPDLDRVVGEAVAALVGAANTYARGGVLCRVVHEPTDKRIVREDDAPTIRPHTKATLERELSTVARFLRIDDRTGAWVRSAPHAKVLQAILDAGAWPGLRPLVGVASAPILRADGTIAQTPGYDAASGILLAFDPRRIVAVGERPTKEDVIGARDTLFAIVQDFPFESDAHRSAWLSLVLTLLARAAIPGPCPMWTFTANVRGAGKSRLVDCAAIIATGRGAPRATQPADDAEAGKVITSIVMAGDELLLLDNVDRPLGGSKLDALLTGERWKDRVLGGNLTVDLPIRVVLAATGNNIEPRGDTIRRVLPVRLDSEEENPEDRTDFAIKEPLLAYVRKNRPRLVACALTMLRAWYVAGCPKSEDVATWGSFESWAAIVPHALCFAGLPDPQKTREGLERDDPQLRALVVVLTDWPKVETACQRTGVTIHQALDRLYPSGQPSANTDHDDLRAALETLAPGKGNVRVDARALGNVFRRARGRVLGGRRLVETGHDEHAGVARWSIQ